LSVFFILLQETELSYCSSKATIYFDQLWRHKNHFWLSYFVRKSRRQQLIFCLVCLLSQRVSQAIGSDGKLQIFLNSVETVTDYCSWPSNDFFAFWSSASCPPSSVSPLASQRGVRSNWVNDRMNLQCDETCVGERVIRARRDPTLLDDSRVLENLLKLEDRYLVSTNYFDHVQEDVKPYMREMVATWMMQVPKRLTATTLCAKFLCKGQLCALSRPSKGMFCDWITNKRRAVVNM